MRRAVSGLFTLCVTVTLLSAGTHSSTALQAPTDTGQSVAETVLFDSAEPLEITILTDLRTVLRDIDSLERQEHEAQLVYTERDGTTRTLDIQVRTRGHFRRQRRNCDFPPLRLNLKKGQVRGTPFQNQDKIKLVTHCQSGRDDYEQNVLEEYLVYRLYNRLSEASHRVRLARITYQDTAGREDDLTRYGFFIETEEELAARLGGTITEQALPAETMNPDLMGIIDVFQYMVGNTDWSVVGLHNIIVIQTPTDFFPVPFDFDWTGVVDARYAEPDHRLNLQSVRDRLYRGSCHPPEDVARITAWFTEQRDTMYGEIQAVEGLNERNKQSIAQYFDDFFEMLDNPRDVRRAFMSRCT